ncbi:hypothetical protein ACL02U_23205 [Streptomyces sp. MS06]|uniref:hypothetical protein n=1 Tax=Streptomyces sp. MS06 TaxID=3385974 RepID=UPI00399FF395
MRHERALRTRRAILEAAAALFLNLQAEALQAPRCTLRLQSLIDLTFEYARRLRTDPALRAGVRLTVEQTSFRSRGIRPYRGAEDAVSLQLLLADEQGELLPGLDIEEATQFIILARNTSAAARTARRANACAFMRTP